MQKILKKISYLSLLLLVSQVIGIPSNIKQVVAVIVSAVIIVVALFVSKKDKRDANPQNINHDG